MLEVEGLRMERDIIIAELIRKVNWLNGNVELVQTFKNEARHELEKLSLPILESHSKILKNNVQRQENAMNERLTSLKTEMFALLKGDISDDIYVEAQKLEQAAPETERLRKDYMNATSKILKDFEVKVEEIKRTIDAEVLQLLTYEVNDYKQMLSSFAIASNHAKEKIPQIHDNLQIRARTNLLKSLKLGKYSCDTKKQLQKLQMLIDESYKDATVAYNQIISEWDDRLVSCNDNAMLRYKQCFNSKLGSASSDEGLRKLHQVLKEEAIGLWEEAFPIHFFGGKMLSERRKLAKRLDAEFEENQEYSEVARNELKLVDKPKNIDEKIYDDLLSSRLVSTLDCFLEQNLQKRKSVLSDLSIYINQLKETLRRELNDLKVLPEKTQLFDANRQQVVVRVNNYCTQSEVTQELVSFVEKSLRDTISDLTSEWDNVQSDSNELQLAINAAVSEYHKEMENRTSKAGVIFKNKSMKGLHQLSSKIVYDKFQKKVKQTSATQERFHKTIDEMLKVFEDQNDLKAAENSEAAIGIDLGTTLSCVAIYKGGKIEIIPDREHHSNTVPSYVFYESDTKTVVGHSAKDQSILHPHTTIFDSKRLIGRKFNDPDTQKDITQWPFKVVQDQERGNGETKIEVHGKTFHPEEVSGEILKHLRKNAEQHLDREVRDVVITVPAYFNDAQKRATKNAAAFAGINVLEIINEPTSAAIAYSLNYTDGNSRNILVFDLGGGTFDTSVLSTENCNIKVKAVGGDNHLGGEDFDANMVDFCIEKFRQETGITIEKNVSGVLPHDEEKVKTLSLLKVLESLRRLRQKCEQAKINLSKMDKVRVVVDYIYNQEHLDVEVTVEDFNKMNKKLFDKCIGIVKNTVAESKLLKTEITDVVLVGGSSRIPEVQRLLSEFFDGKSLIMTLNPDEVVAQGAAYRAAMLSGSKSRELAALKFQDVNPLSLGIKVIGGVFSVILPKNTPLPAQNSDTYYTTRDYQTEMEIAVYEGEEKEVSKNNLLGTFFLTNIPSKRKHEEPVEVTIACDDEGLLHVTAKILSNEKSQDIKIQSNKGGLTQEDIQEILSRQST
ncbi:Heat shock cognate 71 kDa protein [Pseudolycoriella hygida]|uniref:Heat shock cognate 71 kDa protein n=1 Tax=Pseudolycoriella hygida TaxID=35572 RepID=A0A9Q0S4L7_9DIPT|nr:Heat shock cognate 71 kDa protein [Pseudolycoriella hygida]